MDRNNDFVTMCKKLAKQQAQEIREQKEVDMYELARAAVKDYLYESKRKHPILALKAELRECNYKEMRNTNIAMFATAMSCFTLIITLVKDWTDENSFICWIYGVVTLGIIAYCCFFYGMLGRNTVIQKYGNVILKLQSKK